VNADDDAAQQSGGGIAEDRAPHPYRYPKNKRRDFGDALYLSTFGQRESHPTDAVFDKWAREVYCR